MTNNTPIDKLTRELHKLVLIRDAAYHQNYEILPEVDDEDYRDLQNHPAAKDLVNQVITWMKKHGHRPYHTIGEEPIDADWINWSFGIPENDEVLDLLEAWYLAWIKKTLVQHDKKPGEDQSRWLLKRIGTELTLLSIIFHFACSANWEGLESVNLLEHPASEDLAKRVIAHMKDKSVSSFEPTTAQWINTAFHNHEDTDALDILFEWSEQYSRATIEGYLDQYTPFTITPQEVKDETLAAKQPHQ